MSFDPQFPVGTVDSGDVGVTDASVYTLLETLELAGDYTLGTLGITVGAGGAIAALKLTRSALVGGPEVDWLEDADFNTPTSELAASQPSNIHQLAAGASGLIRLKELRGVGQVRVYAKKATTNTTVRVTGTFHVRDC